MESYTNPTIIFFLLNLKGTQNLQYYSLIPMGRILFQSPKTVKELWTTMEGLP